MTGANGHALIGESEPMRRLRATIALAAPTKLAVLIEGETGAGKELVAAALHAQSGRRGRFVAFNVCAIGDAMFEDALFGHVRGAFTGAVSDSPGLLREADGGTAFFDEVSGLAPLLQAKLLRAIETGQFRPVGARADVRSDFRVVAATNERLDELVRRNLFRADLAHRLGAARIPVPALRDRVEDIPLLVQQFISPAGAAPRRVTPGALRLLAARRWPGNVRELRQVVEWAAIVAGPDVDEGALDTALALRGATGGIELGGANDAEQLRAALERCGWDKARAADELGVHLATVYRRIKRHHLVAGIRTHSHTVDANAANAAGELTA